MQKASGKEHLPETAGHPHTPICPWGTAILSVRSYIRVLPSWVLTQPQVLLALFTDVQGHTIKESSS